MRSVDTPSGMVLDKLGVDRFDFGDPYRLAVTLSWPRFFVLLFAVELVTNLVFATLYALVPGSVANAPPGSLIDLFFFSIETLATVGYGVMAPATLYGHIVSSVEILCGLTLTAVFTGLIFVRFSRPRAKIVFADKAVVTTLDGKPTLMLRIANGRANLLGEGRATITMLVRELTPEGHRFRRNYDVRLVRATLPVFALSWTLMHEIDDASPLRGVTAEGFVERDIRLFVTVEARDPAISNTVYALRSYGPEDVAFGMRYVDAISWSEGQHATFDLRKISLIEPGEAEAAI